VHFPVYVLPISAGFGHRSAARRVWAVVCRFEKALMVNEWVGGRRNGLRVLRM